MGWLVCGAGSDTYERRDGLTEQPLQKLYAGLPLYTPIMRTGITPRRGHTAATAMCAVTVQEYLEGDAEHALMRLIEASAGAVATRVRIAEYRFPSCGALIGPSSEVTGCTQEQQRQPGEHSMHQGMPGHVRWV